MPTLLERTEQKGIQKGKIESILLLLSSRFGFVPPQVVEQLNTIEQTDVFRLNDLLIFASKCESIEEFEKAL